MMDDTEHIINFLRQYAEGEPEVLLDPSAENARKSPPRYESSGELQTRETQLRQLNERTSTCTKCALHEGRTNVVFGVGNPRAKLMFVGEGPGADEDRKGEPFVGRAGQLLNRIIAAMKMTRKEVYIANIVKCRPPENRAPLPDEALTCLPYLQTQIDLIMPEVVVALGATAATYLLNLRTGDSIKSLRGRIHELGGRPLVVTYHPAALLRNQKYKAPTWDDMQMVMKILSGEITYEPDSSLGLNG